MFPFPPPLYNSWQVLAILGLPALLLFGSGYWLFRLGSRLPAWGPPVWLTACAVLLAWMITNFTHPYMGGDIRRIAQGLAWIYLLCVIATVVMIVRILQRDFTYEKLLCYTVFGALLLLLPMPDHINAIEPARRTQCRQNLKQLGLAMYNYDGKFDSFPRHATSDPPHSWRLELLPYLQQESDLDEIYGAYDFSQPWDADVNWPVATKHVRSLTCPTAVAAQGLSDKSGGVWTAYFAVVGDNSVFQDQRTLTAKEIPDGSSNTAMFVEACGQRIVWSSPQDLVLDQTPIGVNLPGHTRGQSDGVLSSYHLGGSTLVLADGAARFISQSISTEVLRQLLQVNDGVPNEPF